MKPYIASALILVVTSCTTKQPFEDSIVTYFEKHDKVVPEIESVTIDSVKSIGLYLDLFRERAEGMKETDQNRIRMLIDKDILEIADLKETPALPGGKIDTPSVKRYERSIQRYVNALKNLDSLYKADPFTRALMELSEATGNYTAVTVRYKLPDDGVVSIRNFVISPDTTVYENTDTFHRFMLFRLPHVLYR